MTTLQKPAQSGDGRGGKRWYKFGHADEVVRRTDAWEHETFAEEQARWERSDPTYARICEDVRRAKKKGEEASRRADQVKADWDGRVGRQREANDAAQRAHHVLKADQMARRQPETSPVVSSSATDEPSATERSDPALGDPRSAGFHIRTTFVIESNEALAPGIIPEPVRVHDQPDAPRLAASGRTRDQTVVVAWPTKPGKHRACQVAGRYPPRQST